MQVKRMNGNLFRLLAINGCENLKLNYEIGKREKTHFSPRILYHQKRSKSSGFC